MQSHPWNDWIRLFLLSLMWGTSFLFTKIALDQLEPIAVVTWRLVLGAVVLFSLARRRGLRVPSGWHIWLHLLALSLLGNTLPFLLISWGQQSIDSGLAAMLLAWMPLATLVLAHFLIEGETITRWSIAGFLIGLAGVATLVGPDALRNIGGNNTEVLSQAAICTAALCYSCNAILARHLPPGGDPITHTAATISLAALTVLPFGLLAEGPRIAELSISTLFALTWLGAISTAAATVLYFRIIASAGPTFLSLINYLIPPIALVAGAIVLSERPTPQAMIALIIILLGIAVSQKVPAKVAGEGE